MMLPMGSHPRRVCAVLACVFWMSACSRESHPVAPSTPVANTPPVEARADEPVISSQPDASMTGPREPESGSDSGPASEPQGTTESTLVGTLRYRTVENSFGEVIFRGFMLVCEGETYVISMSRSDQRRYRALDGRRVRVTGMVVEGSPFAQFDPSTIHFSRIELDDGLVPDGG